MKRTATLVAGLLLVTGTVFAEGKLSADGTVIKAKTKLVNSEYNSVADDSNGDTDLILKLNYQLDDKTTVSLGYDTDDDNDSTEDNTGELLVNRKEGKVEAQFDGELDFTGKDGEFLGEDLDSDKTFIKYNHTDSMSVTFYPYNMGLGNGSVFDETDSFTEIPGVVLKAGNAYVGFGMDAVTSEEQVMAVKAGYDLVAGDTKVSLKYSGAFWDKDKLTSALEAKAIGGTATTVGYAGSLGIVAHDVNVHAEMKLSEKVAITAEAGMNVLIDDVDMKVAGGTTTEEVGTGYGVSVKATLGLTDKVVPYAQVKYTTDGYLAYGDMEDWNINNSVKNVGDDLTYTGGVLELIGGVDYKLTDKLTLNGEAVMKNAGEKLFADEGTSYQEKTAFEVSATAKYAF